ncbi:MAG: SUMF1/EgtB/PvdO family nonheme iron enzyme [Planctomycetota bacterium]
MKRNIVATIALGVCLAIAASASADVVGGITLDFVPISGDASALNGTGWGTSGDTFTDPAAFRMGKYEVTRAQWDVFVAAAGAPTGTPANAFDNAPTTTGNQPVNNVSFFEAIQFVNWLNISSGEQAAYKVVGGVFDVWSVGESYEGTNRYRHKDAFYFLPDLDEVLKAAYWNGTSFNTYANATNTAPTPAESCFSASGGLWNVGSGAVELNGTFDMMGNMGELQEQDFGYAYSTATNAGHRLGPGASIVPVVPFAQYAGWTGFNANADVEATYAGFRVASVPEPATMSLLVLGGLAVLRRRRK